MAPPNHIYHIINNNCQDYVRRVRVLILNAGGGPGRVVRGFSAAEEIDVRVTSMDAEPLIDRAQFRDINEVMASQGLPQIEDLLNNWVVGLYTSDTTTDESGGQGNT